ncbi:MAG: hypothetical protein ACRCU5_02915 [Rhizobiaceae bacterium]
MKYNFLDTPAYADRQFQNDDNDRQIMDRKVMNDLLSLCRTAMHTAADFGAQGERIDMIARHVERIAARPTTDAKLMSAVSDLSGRMQKFEDTLAGLMQKLESQSNETALKVNTPLVALSDALAAQSEVSNTHHQRNHRLAEQIFELLAEHKSSNNEVSANLQERLNDLAILAGDIMRRPEKDQAALITPLIEVVKSVAELKGDVRATNSLVENNSRILAAIPQGISDEFKRITGEQTALHAELRDTVRTLQDTLAQSEQRLISGMDAHASNNGAQVAGLLMALESIAGASTSVLKSVNRIEDNNLSADVVERMLEASQNGLRQAIGSLSSEIESHKGAMSKELGNQIISILPAIEKIAALCGECVSEATASNGKVEAHIAKANDTIGMLSRDVHTMPVKLVASLNSFATKQDLAKLIEPVAAKVGEQMPEFANLSRQIEAASKAKDDANNEALNRSHAAIQTAVRDITVNAGNLREAAQEIRASASTMKERIDVHVAAPVLDFTPTTTLFNGLASRMEETHLAVVSQANAAITRIEELEQRREERSVSASEIGKDGMSRILIGFRLLMDKVDREATALSEAVAAIEARAAAPVAANVNVSTALDNEEISRFERATSILAEAIATIEPTILRSLNGALHTASGMPIQENGNNLLGRLMLNSISRVNLVCSDVQEALSDLKGYSTDDASVLQKLNDLAARTREGTGQLIDVAAAIEADILTIASPAGAGAHQSAKGV